MRMAIKVNLKWIKNYQKLTPTSGKTELKNSNCGHDEMRKKRIRNKTHFSKLHTARE